MNESGGESGSIICSGVTHLDWDTVLARVRVHLAAVPADRGLVTEAICKTKGMLVMLDLASWEDHIEDLIRPQLESLLAVLETAQRESIQKGETQ